MDGIETFLSYRPAAEFIASGKSLRSKMVSLDLALDTILNVFSPGYDLWWDESNPVGTTDYINQIYPLRRFRPGFTTEYQRIYGDWYMLRRDREHPDYAEFGLGINFGFTTTGVVIQDPRVTADYFKAYQDMFKMAYLCRVAQMVMVNQCASQTKARVSGVWRTRSRLFPVGWRDRRILRSPPAGVPKGLVGL